MTVPPILEVVSHVEGLTPDQINHLVSALIMREDAMADEFRMAGMQFGLYPWIVAEVFAEVGIGTPLSEDERRMVRHQFEQGMEELRRQMGG